MKPTPIHFERTEGRIKIILIQKDHRDSWSETRVLWSPSEHQWFGWCKSYWRHGSDWNDTETDGGFTDLTSEDLLAIREVFGLASRGIGPQQVLHMSPDELVALRAEHLREQAYYHWERRGHPCGDALSDWFAAEKELGGLSASELAVLAV